MLHTHDTLFFWLASIFVRYEPTNVPSFMTCTWWSRTPHYTTLHYCLVQVVPLLITNNLHLQVVGHAGPGWPALLRCLLVLTRLAAVCNVYK